MAPSVYSKLFLVAAISITGALAQSCGLADLADDCEIKGLPNATALCGAAATSSGSTAAYVFAHASNGTVSAYEADSTTGVLTFLDSITSGSPPDIASIVAHPTLPFIYTVEGGAVDGLSFDTATGLLTRLSGFPVTHAHNGYSLFMNPTGTKLFHGTLSGSVVIYSVNQSTGALTLLSDSVWQDCYSMALNTAETKLYCIDQGQLHTATLLASGAFSVHAASVAGSANGIRLVPNTSFMFSSSASGGIIYRHTINAGTQHPAAGVNTGLNLVNIRPLAHPTGSHVILPLSTGEVRSYSIDSTTGVLTLTDTLAASVGLRWPAMSTDGAFVYFPTGAASVGAASFNSSSGDLATVTGSPFSTQGNGTPVAVTTGSY